MMETKIPLCKTKIFQEAKDNAARVLDSGWPGMGPEVEKFEREFADYLGARHVIMTNSGTEALRLAVHIVSRRTDNGYAVSTPNTFIASNSVLLQNDMYPVFTDIELGTGMMSLSDAELALQTYRCGLIMLVHYGGYPADIDSFEHLAKSHGVDVIHDCAHATGSIYKGRKVGANMKYACFSFHGVKPLAIGDGGALVSNDDEVALKARQLRWFGIDKSTYERSRSGLYSWEYSVEDIGYKSQMWDVQAAIGRGQLIHLEECIEKRARLANRYRKNLYSNSYPKPINTETEGDRTSNCMFVVQFEDEENRQKAMQAMVDNGIQYGYHYKPNYLYKHYDTFPIIGKTNMERFYKTSLSLPLYMDMTEEQVDTVCEVICNT